jgi:hypothetical protein
MKFFQLVLRQKSDEIPEFAHQCHRQYVQGRYYIIFEHQQLEVALILKMKAEESPLVDVFLFFEEGASISPRDMSKLIINVEKRSGYLQDLVERHRAKPLVIFGVN